MPPPHPSPPKKKTRLKFLHGKIQSQSEASDTVIMGFLLALARTQELKQNVCLVRKFHVRITFRCTNLHDMTNPILEIPKSQSAAARVGEGRGNTALVCMTIYTSMGKQLRTLPSHPTLGEPEVFSRGEER